MHTAIVTEILGTPDDTADRTKLRVVNNSTIFFFLPLLSHFFLAGSKNYHLRKWL